MPVAQNPYENSEAINDAEKAEGIKYFKGRYVCRVTVKPVESKRPYVPDSRGKHEQYYYSRKCNFYSDAAIERVTPSDADEETRERDTKYSAEDRQFVLSFRRDPFLDRKCKAPLEGIPIEEPLPSGPEPDTPLPAKFQHCCILVVKHIYHEDVKKKLKMNHNIEVEIDVPFKQDHDKMKGVRTSALLYHNVDFEKLLSIMSYKSEFEYDGRYVLVINIGKFIELKDFDENKEPGEGLFEDIVKLFRTRKKYSS